MASVLRVGARTSAGIFDRAFLGLSASATLPHFAATGTLNGSLMEVAPLRGGQASWAARAARGLATRSGGGVGAGAGAGAGAAGQVLGRSSPAPAAAAAPGAAAAHSQRRAPAPAPARPSARAVDSDASSDSDSDSDLDEPRRERGSSEFWRRKMMTFHSLIDLNNDGVVSFDDFKILADRFINLGHLTPAQEEDFREALKVVWEDQWGKVHPYNLVTTQQYLDNMHHIINDREQSRKAHHFLPHLFEALDKDKDGLITVDEFKIFFECLGRTEEDAIMSYKVIDTNGDGFLSLKEFVRLGRDYFTVDDENHPSTFFWGPMTIP